MTKAYKIIWKDGTFLYPHHFQQQDRYYSHLFCHYHLLNPVNNWGILELEIDESYLKLNKVVITKCIGVFPDGTYFNIPERDSVPEVLHIPENYDGSFIYIGIPIQDKCYTQNLSPTKSGAYRYYTEEVEIPDNNCETEDKSITVGKLNINLFLSHEDLSQVVAMPILQLVDASNGINLNDHYIPPCLRVNSSKILKSYVGMILGLLNQYMNSSIHLIGKTFSPKNLTMMENYLILQTISKYKYLFELLVKDQTLTPQHLFAKLIELIGSLIIFTKQNILGVDQLYYNHLDLIASYQPQINLLSTIFEELKTYIILQIILEKSRDNFYNINLDKVPPLKFQNLILAIDFKNKVSSKEQTEVQHTIKVASQNDIERIVSLQVAGINFSSLNILPSYVSYDEKTLYYKIEQSGDLWKTIEDKKSLAVYLNVKSNEVLKLKLWVVPKDDIKDY